MPCPLRVILAAVSAFVAAVLLYTQLRETPTATTKQQASPRGVSWQQRVWRTGDFVLSLFTGRYLLQVMQAWGKRGVKAD